MGPTAAPAAPAQAPMPTATTSQQAQQNLQQFQGGMQSASQIQSATEQALGLPAAQQQVSGLRQAITNTTNLLNQVAPSVYGRTQDSLVTQAQAGRQIQNEQAPIANELKGQTTAAGNAQTDYQNLHSQADKQEASQMSDQQNQLNNLQKVYEDLYTKEQQAMANQLEQQKIDASNASNSSQSALNSLLGGALGGNSSTSSTPTSSSNQQFVTQRSNDKGFNFTDPNSGKSINALQYALGSSKYNGNLRGLLNDMASAGDPGAKTALGIIGNVVNGQATYNPTKITNQATANLIQALTGQKVSVYQPAKSITVATRNVGKGQVFAPQNEQQLLQLYQMGL
jgi:hypothetical protein